MNGSQLRDIKIGVLMGGVSNERAISLVSGREALRALERSGLCACGIDIATSNPVEIKRLISSLGIDLAFIALHGRFGEDGSIQSILEQVHIPYTGSGPYASRLAMDKIAAKKAFRRCGIPTPSFIILEKHTPCPELQFPKVIKPHYSGSSLGVSIVSNRRELDAALGRAFAVSQKVIVEEYIEGRELTVGILKDIPLSVVEIIPKQGYYDYITKYADDMADFDVPARLETETYCRVMEIADSAHRTLGLRHFSRVDMRLSRTSEPYVLEVNSIPGLTSHSLLPLAASARGIDFTRLIVTMVSCALEDEKAKEQQTASQ